MFLRCVAFRTGLLASLAVGATAWAGAQDANVLTLSDALRMAMERNGTIIASRHDVQAARARVGQARAAFLPTLTPSYTYNSARRELATTGGSTFVQDEGGSSLLSASWRLFDSGERMYSMRASRSALSAQEFSAEQTLRATLFAVTQQYYEALRSQELKRVADEQVSRAGKILDQIRARIDVKDAAEIERYQAEADHANALVSAMVAKNRVTNAAATLKGTLGLEPARPLPPLQKEAEVQQVTPAGELDALIREGLENRPDLLARRQNLDALRFSHERAKREAGLTFGLDANFNQQLTPRSLENRALTLNLSYPLFDGGRRRAIARETAQNIEAEKASLLQAERTVRAEIEAAHAEFAQNAERLGAANKALEAARINFRAAEDSHRAGAYDLLQVITAQLSLTTAEANYIEAIYDYRISEARLKLVTGRDVPGQ